MSRKTEFGQRLAMLVLTPVLKFFVHFDVRGKENLKDVPTNMIFVMNHISELDVVLLPCTFNIFSKQIAIYYVSFGRDVYKGLKTLRSILFYREGIFQFFGAYAVELGIRDYDKSLALHIDFLKQGKNVAIFPEGGISRPGKIREPKGGVIALVKATGLPVVPVLLSGHANTSAKDFLLRRRKATLTFGKPIYPEELFAGYENAEPDKYAEIAKEKVMKKINVLS